VKKSHKYGAASDGKGRTGAAVASKTSAVQTRKRFALSPCAARLWTYALGFISLLVFSTLVYGAMFVRAEQDSYISTSPDTMHFVLSQSGGALWWVMRWALLVFKWCYLGGLLLALVWTLTARLTDYALRVPRSWEGVGFVLPLIQIGWMIWRGTNLYYKSEPSMFVFIALLLLLIAALAAGITFLVRRKKQKAAPANVSGAIRPWGCLTAFILINALSAFARYFNENEIYTARLQLLENEERWEEMIDIARSARRPSRAVAAYYAIALEETDQLLDGVYDIPYEYPKVRLDKHDGSEEYGLFVSDCNFHAGLLNPAYRTAMDQVVMNGVRLFHLKQMARAALLNEEYALCRKYVTLISQNPFEGDFVEKYNAFLANPKSIAEDATFAHVKGLRPMEDNFEQNYAPPAFLGYNCGLRSGNNATLVTSAAACLYSKDLQAFLLRAQIMAQKGMAFPSCMQQAIAIMALKQPDLLKAFPQVGKFVPDEIRSFLLDAKPLVGDRLRVRHELRKQWLGTYVYYYYTENNDPDQVAKPEGSAGKAGVN